MDDIFLSNGGTSVNLGTYLRSDPGADYGEKDLLRPAYSENAISEGGVLAYETVGVRRMAFPLTLPSGGAGLSLSGLQSLLRVLARPGAVLDVQPEYVATGDAVRFDVLTGRWKPDHNVRHWEYGRAQGVLELDTQPFGYSPTWVILASAASVGLPGQLALPNASLIGDVPGLLSVAVQPSNPAVTTQVGTWLVDALAWSVAARPSFTSLLPGGSWVSAVASGAYAARSEAITATVLQWMLASDMHGWSQIAYYDIPAALEPAYRGRFRAFAYARQSLSLQGEFNTMQLLLDSTVLNPSGPMASANAIATLPVQAPSVYAPHLLDLGEVTLPPVASGVARDVRLRLWGYKATSAATTQTFGDLAGVALLPLDGPNGILPRGLAGPVEAPFPGRFTIDADEHSAVVGAATGPLGSQLPIMDALRYYRGGMPLAGGSSMELTLVAGSRRRATGGYENVVRSIPGFRDWWKLDEPAAAATLIDSGIGVHGVWLNSPSLAQSPLAASGQAVALDGETQWAHIANHPLLSGQNWTIAAWTRRAAAGKNDIIYTQGIASTSRGVFIRYTDADVFRLSYYGAGGPVDTSSFPDVDQTHHWAITYTNANALVNIYRDGQLVASKVATSLLPNTDIAALGGPASALQGGGGGVGATWAFNGILDEMLCYSGALSADSVRALYEAGIADRHLARPAPAHAAVSVLYRPRFAFIKGGV